MMILLFLAVASALRSWASASGGVIPGAMCTWYMMLVVRRPIGVAMANELFIFLVCRGHYLGSHVKNKESFIFNAVKSHVSAVYR